ncbi:MAG: FAD:protein FMN transferase [Owenweeksia sp.]|nr:FAD:protein FMN transferase [Owenweeksia sp.]
MLIPLTQPLVFLHAIKLLSVSIITKSCMDADAYATSCMVMGREKARDFLRFRNDLEAYLISTDDKGEWEVWTTDGFAKFLIH